MSVVCIYVHAYMCVIYDTYMYNMCMYMFASISICVCVGAETDI